MITPFRFAAIAVVGMISLVSCTDSRETRVGSGDTVAGGTTDSALLPVPAPSIPSPPVAAEPARGWVVNSSGLGAVEIGSSRTEVERLLGHALQGRDSTSECFFLRSDELPEGVIFMFTNGTLARIDIVSANVATTLGARVGDTDDSIKSIYPGQVTAAPHAYVEGEYLSVGIPGSALRLIFETARGVVTRYRIGRLPEVEWVEGCS